MIRRIALCTLLGVAVVLTLSWLLYERRVQGELARAAAQNSTLASNLADTLRSDFERTALDLRLLSELGTSDLALREPTEEHLSRARQDFETFARSRPHYFQVRCLDRKGTERIRLDRNGDVVSHAAMLQDKSDRYYVLDMFKLPVGQVYVSPLDWNVEFGKVEQPGRPTIRFGLWRGEGAVLVNADARLVLRGLKEAGSAFQGRIRLVDATNGAVLVEASGGAWTFLPESPTPRGADDITGDVRVSYGGRSWAVECGHDRRTLLAQARLGFQDHLQITGAIVLLLMAAGSLAVRAARRAAQLQHAERHAAELEAVNLELRRTRELVVERTRLATVGEMVPVLAHELRNPLQAMLTAARTLRQDVSSDDGRRLLDILLDEITRLDAIAADLLQGGTKRVPEPCDLAVLTRRVVDMIAAGRAEGAVAQIHLEVGDGRTTVNAVPDLVKQVLWNVLLNACEAAGPRGGVWVRVAREAAQVVAQVEDDGPGMGAKPQGHGIGLSLCEQLVREHGGTLELGSSPRGGARVRVVLPAFEQAGVQT